MGTYLNPTSENFKMAINDFIYVDKTNIIKNLNSLIGKRNRYICISRPRRFGKTMVAEMLCAYYAKGNDSKKLFRKFDIYNHKSFLLHLNKYDVIHINVQNFLTKNKTIDLLTKSINKKIIKELKNNYKIIDKDIINQNSLDEVLDYVYNNFDDCNGFIFVIDEWDAIFRDKNIKENGQKNFLDYLMLLLKDRTYVKLAYMTGILPIKKYGSHSALNMFEENTMIDSSDYGSFFGFTLNEVKNITKNKFDIKAIKKWYDGYSIGNNKTIFNPKSVTEAILKKEISNYWARTETFESLKIYIDLDYNGLKSKIIDLLMDKSIAINTNSFQNDMNTFNNADDVLTLLVHLGYLTYDKKNKSVSIPNLEIRQEFEIAIKNDDRKELIKAIKLSDELLNATINMDKDTVARIIDSIHIDYTDIKHYNSEESLSNVIKLAYYTARDKYTYFYELEAGYGYADMVFIPYKPSKSTPAFIIELKYNQSTDIGIRQIIDKKYSNKLDNYKNNLLLVSINYDKKNKKHECEIIKYS